MHEKALEVEDGCSGYNWRKGDLTNETGDSALVMHANERFVFLCEGNGGRAGLEGFGIRGSAVRGECGDGEGPVSGLRGALE